MGFFQRMMLRLQQFMYGRYGGDAFNLALMVVGLLWSVVWRMTPWPLVSLLFYAFYGFAIFRMFSKNHAQRRRENAWFLKTFGPAGRWIRSRFRQLRDHQHRYFACPNCKQTCRVPRGRGKIEIRCPKCQTRFVKKA